MSVDGPLVTEFLTIFQVNRLNILDQLLDWGSDGIITDYPAQIRQQLQQAGRSVAPRFPKKRVLDCLEKHLERT